MLWFFPQFNPSPNLLISKFCEYGRHTPNQPAPKPSYIKFLTHSNSYPSTDSPGKPKRTFLRCWRGKTANKAEGMSFCGEVNIYLLTVNILFVFKSTHSSSWSLSFFSHSYLGSWTPFLCIHPMFHLIFIVMFICD